MHEFNEFLNSNHLNELEIKFDYPTQILSLNHNTCQSLKIL